MKTPIVKIFLLAVTLLLATTMSGCGKKEQVKISETRFAMDTFVKIDAFSDDQNQGRQIVDDALQVFVQTAKVNDRFNNGGDGSLYNANLHAATTPVKLAPQLADILTFLQTKTDNEIDVSIAPLVDVWQLARDKKTLPAQSELDVALTHVGKNKYIFAADTQTLRYNTQGVKLDLGAVAKGYAVDAAAAVLKKNKAISGALINAGGNIKAIGNKPDNTPWRIAIQHPRANGNFLGTLLLSDGQAAATSGDYQRYYEFNGVRYHHILNPKDGQPMRLHQSVTVISTSALEADYYSTLFFLLPTSEIKARLQNEPALATVVVEANGDIFVSENLRQKWQPAKEG